MDLLLLGRLAVAVTGDIQQLKTAFKETKGEVKSLDKEVAKSGLGLKQIAKYGMLAGAAIVTAMGMATLSTAKYGEEIDLLAIKTGANREQLQGLVYAAKLEGVEMENLGMSLSRLSRNMYEASKGTGTAKGAFKDLGVQITDSNGELRNSVDVMLDIADKFKGMTNTAERTALAMKVFGRDASSMVPFLSQGRAEIEKLIQQARDLGLVIDSETIQKLHEFNDSMDAVKGGLAGFGLQLAADVLPYMQSFVNVLITIEKWLHSLPEPIRKIITVGTLFAGVIALIGGGLISLVLKINATKIALAGLGASFAPFMIGGAIITAIGLLVNYFGTLKENARLAGLEIAKTLSLPDLLAEQKRIEGEIKRVQALIDARTKSLTEGTKALLSTPKTRTGLLGSIFLGPLFAAKNLKSGEITKPIGDYEAELTGLQGRLTEVTGRIADLGKTAETTPDASVVKFNLSEYLASVTKGLSDIDKTAEMLGDTSGVAGDKASLLKDAIKKLVEEGYDPSKIQILGASITDLFSAFKAEDSFEKDAYNVSEAMVNLDKSLAAVNDKAAVLGDEFDANSEKANLYLNAALDLLAHGIDPTTTSMGDLIAQYQKYQQVSKDAAEAAKAEAERKLHQEEAISLVTEAQQRFAEMTGRSLPEWETFAQSLEKAAAADGVLPETADLLNTLARQIREVGEASIESDPTSFAEAWSAGLKDVSGEAKTYLEHIRDIASTTSESMAGSFSDLFYDSVHGQFKSLLDYALSIFDSISRAWSNMMGQMAANALMNWLFPGSGGAAFAGGGFSGGMPMLAMANGGPVAAGTAYRVGERGPEMFVPSQNGRIIPNDQLGTNVQVNVINQTGQPVSASQGDVKFDGQQYVVNVLLDAIGRNVNGVRDVLKGGK